MVFELWPCDGNDFSVRKCVVDAPGILRESAELLDRQMTGSSRHRQEPLHASYRIRRAGRVV